MNFYFSVIIRLVLACILGGIIGYERENINRPAGFRTHILVCVGSSLVMITSEFVFRRYSAQTNLDPARLGAQVISGIGFLGAGTIIRDGFNVKGLTTAASLWAVSCVGIAAGIGFYEGAIIATIIIYLTLIVLKKIEIRISSKSHYRVIFIESDNTPGLIGAISNIFDKHDMSIKNVEFITDGNGDNLTTKFLVRTPRFLDNSVMMDDMHKVEGIHKVYE